MASQVTTADVVMTVTINGLEVYNQKTVAMLSTANDQETMKQAIALMSDNALGNLLKQAMLKHMPMLDVKPIHVQEIRRRFADPQKS